MKTLAEFQSKNFFRTPDWRWERVVQLADMQPAPGRCSHRDDKFIRKARNFLCRWKHADTPDAQAKLYFETPGLYYAYQFFVNAADEPDGAAMMEARLLARQGFDEIAELLSTIPETVMWYEALFFDVVAHIDKRDWITSRILVPAVLKYHGASHGAANPNPYNVVARPFMDASLKMFAYFGGPHLVDVMLSGFRQGTPLTKPEDMGTWFDEHMSATVRRRSAQASMQFEVNKFNVMQLLETHTRIMELANKDDGSGKRDSYATNIKNLLDSTPWTIGDRGRIAAEGTALGEMDESPAELRDAEVQFVASGQAVDRSGFPDRLPEPRQKKSVLLEDGGSLLK